jgi:hypothetical protein
MKPEIVIAFMQAVVTTNKVTRLTSYYVHPGGLFIDRGRQNEALRHALRRIFEERHKFRISLAFKSNIKKAKCGRHR